tara:strand:+ start:161 stop:1096 length:936 start_codon:yes stop_codon:yes gene_type:complete
MTLSRLTEVDLREVWQNEATDFTNWLASEENLRLLSDEIGIEIVLETTEASIGRFRVDILAKEEITGRKIIIENQLEQTDHDHLGKIITYASGLDAEIIIWIVKDVRDEHKTAVDWLNENTDEKINFFAIRMELWKIGDSEIAPKFHVISQPNEWAKDAKKSSERTELSERGKLQLEFWEKFNEFVKSRDQTFNLRKAYPQHWYSLSVGSSKANISLSIIFDKRLMRCEFYIPDNKSLYYDLENKKEFIESKLNYELEWNPLENKKASRIVTEKNIDLNDSSNWENAFLWLMETSKEFKTVFSEAINKIDN